MYRMCKIRNSGLILVLIIALCPVLSVFADGTTSISLSQNTAEVGNKVVVTINGSDSSTLSLRYNNEVFKFVSCSVAGASENANIISFSGQSGQITLEAIGSGAGDLIVSSDTLSGRSTLSRFSQ